MQPRVVSSVVISDMTCPWCCIGQRELQKALEEVADCGLTVKIDHRPFLLHPTMEEGQVVDRATFYHDKFGVEKLKQIKEMVTTRAEEVGVKVSFEGELCRIHVATSNRRWTSEARSSASWFKRRANGVDARRRLYRRRSLKLPAAIRVTRKCIAFGVQPQAS